MIGIPAEYARHRKRAGLSGKTNDAVSSAIETGRIDVLSDGKIDFEAADIQWEKNTQKHADHHGNQTSPVNPLNDAEPPKQLNWADHRTRREAAEANLKEMELAKRRDELIDRKGAELAAQVTARTLRDTLIETLPSKLAVELAAITDPWALECRLRESIRAELHAIFDHLTEASDVAQCRAA